MNPIDEALKRIRAEKYAERQERRLAGMSERERKRETRLKAAAAAIVKSSEEHKARLQQAHEQRIRMREATVATEANKPKVQAAKMSVEDMLAGIKFFRDEEYKKKLAPTANTCPHAAKKESAHRGNSNGKRPLLLERDYERAYYEEKEKEQRQTCARVLNVNI